MMSPVTQDSQSTVFSTERNSVDLNQLLVKVALQKGESTDLIYMLQQVVDEVQTTLNLDRLIVYRSFPRQTQPLVEGRQSQHPSAIALEWPQISTLGLASPLQQALSEIADGPNTSSLAQWLTQMMVQRQLLVALVVDGVEWGGLMVHRCSTITPWQSTELMFWQQLALLLSQGIARIEWREAQQREIENRKQLEKYLKIQHDQTSHILTANPGLVYCQPLDPSEPRVFYGNALEKLLGYSILDAMEPLFWPNHIHPDDQAAYCELSQLCSQVHQELQSPQNPVIAASCRLSDTAHLSREASPVRDSVIEMEYRIQHQDGSYRWIWDQQKLVMSKEGQPLEWIGFCIDITDRKTAEDKLKASLQEKEILLREIHHRVKNNMNVIIGLLNLQSSYIDDPAVLEMLRDSQSRIRSMALIHQHLYRSTDLSQIEFSDYAQTLIDAIAATHLYLGTEIAWDVAIAPASLNLETAIPCGLILNELITNTYKHAFIGRERGKISVALTSLPQDVASAEKPTWVLTVQDDGKGMSPNYDWENASSLGLRLVHLLSNQLNASIQREAVAVGTCFKLQFQELHYLNRVAG